MIHAVSFGLGAIVALIIATPAAANSPYPELPQPEASPVSSDSEPAPVLPISQSASDLTTPSAQPLESALEPTLTAQSPPTQSPSPPLDLSPEVIENSPVLQRWLREVPDVRSTIRNDPSFRTRLRLGYSQFPSDDHASGFQVGVEDVFVARTGLTLSGEYQQTFDGNRRAYGADLRYYVLPLGSYINVAPVVGYRHLETDRYTTDGANVGLRVLLSLSRTGAADISFTQSWVAPGSSEEVGLSTLSFGYALTHDLRLSTDLQKQNSPESKDSRVGVVLEWML